MWGIARRLTLRQRLLAIVAVAIVPMAAALIYLIVAIHNERAREVRDQAFRTSQIAALEMERIVTGAQSVLESVALAPSVAALDVDCDRYLAAVAERIEYLHGFAVADADGTVICSSDLAFGADGLAGTRWFAPSQPVDTFLVGEYAPGNEPGAAFLPLALWFDASGTTRVIVTGIDLDWLGARLRERRLAQGSALAVADRAGTIIAREPEPERFVGHPISEHNLPLVRAAGPGVVEIISPDGTRRVLGYQPPAATGIGLYVAAGFSTDSAFGPIYARTWKSLAIAALGAAGAFAVAWSVGNRLFRQPIARILGTIGSWRAGDETARTGIMPGGSELTQLATSIDEYMDSLVDVRAARTAAEHHRTLLLREMNHRIKNILAAVQAIANQTFKDRATPESLRAFGSRLAAMAAAHDLLVHENWESADLHQTVSAALHPFGAEGQSHFELEGPPLEISARAALALSMALHELCTNAAKYGALSTPEGRVALRWQLRPGPSGQRFRLTWVESGGPPVSPPERRGFGTRLIQAALADELAAEAELDFAPDGLRFAFDADAASVLAPLPATAAAPA